MYTAQVVNLFQLIIEMDKIQRQNRERMMILDTEIHHLRFLVEKTLNYQLPGTLTNDQTTLLKNNFFLLSFFAVNFSFFICLFLQGKWSCVYYYMYYYYRLWKT